MKILFVINNYYITGNGLSASARRTVKALREAGHEVRILSGCGPDDPKPDYPLRKFRFPIFQPLIDSQGFSFAASTFEEVEEAVKWADVVHLEEVFVLQWKAIKAAGKWGKPVTGTYHLHPENIFSSLGMGSWKGINRLMMKLWRKYIFNDCLIVQCPTENVQDRLRRYHFKSELRVISNGVIPDKCIRPETPPQEYFDPERPLEVICIGRLSREKDQQTLFEAMRYAQSAGRIRLTLAGKGPMEQEYRKIAHRLEQEGILRYPVQFKFLDRDGLRELAAGADLAIHCADIEVEGLSIMEALQQGVVPIIAEGNRTGTSQFAMDRHSVFPKKNPEALANRIDYWLARPEARWEMGEKLVKNMEQYNIGHSIEQLVQMFQDAIDMKKAQ